MIGEELSHFGVNFRFREQRRWTGATGRKIRSRHFFRVSLLFLIGVENFQKGFVNIRTPEKTPNVSIPVEQKFVLLMKSIFDFVHVVDRVIEFDRLAARRFFRRRGNGRRCGGFRRWFRRKIQPARRAEKWQLGDARRRDQGTDRLRRRMSRRGCWLGRHFHFFRRFLTQEIRRLPIGAGRRGDR